MLSIRNWVFSTLYNGLILVGALIYLPKLMYRVFRGQRRFRTVRARYWPTFPSLSAGKGRLIWVHAVSFGETKAVTALVESLQAESEDVRFVVSSITETGHAEAKKAFPFAQDHLYLPLDLSWVMRALLRRIKPDLVLVTETDYWYHFLQQAKAVGAKAIVVNGKVSPSSAQHLKKFRFFSQRLFKLIDLFCVQSTEYRDRFIEIGVSESRLKVTGNLKFDADYSRLDPAGRQALCSRLGISKDQPVLLVGSSHDGEEKLILDVCTRLWKSFPTLKLVLVPRHPERFDAVADLVQARGLTLRRYSDRLSPSDSQVALVDGMGLLRQCYQLATIAIVAGSFDESVGGHNILEACAYGVPTLFGPFMHQQPELCQMVLEAQAGLQLTPDQLEPELRRLLCDPSACAALGASGQALVERNQGCLERTLKEIAEVF